MPDTEYANGAAYLKGRYMPVDQAAIPVIDAGYRRSDVTYDVVGVREGNFFRLDDHIGRFRRSMTSLRMNPPESDDEIRAILHKLVALAGLRNAYVSMECVRGAPPPGKTRHPANCLSYLSCHAVPWLSIASDDMFRRGVHLIIPKARRIPHECLDPKVKNFHWGDLTQGLFEAQDAGADYAVHLDSDGNITEGAGFNVMCIVDGTVVSPANGALEGITRASVFELCEEIGIPVEIRDITANEFREADEIFICSTAGGIIPVSRVDGRILTNDAPGPISIRLRETFWTRRNEGWYSTPVEYCIFR